MKRIVSVAISCIAMFASFFFVAQTILANNQNLTSSVTVGNAAPTVSSVNLNGGSNITLVASTTQPVNVSAVVADNNGCTDLTGGTTTIVLYRTGQGSNCAASNLNCYRASVFTASSTCSGGQTSVNTTTTFNVQYYAQATDGSSSFPTDSWTATVNFTDPSGATGTANSATTSLITLNAIVVATSSINYGTLAASSTSPFNQSTTVANVGNSSTTLQLSGTALVSGANTIATTSQHYATSSFTFGGAEQQLSGSANTVSGFKLTSPTSTSGPTSSIFWAINVPGGTATGTFNGTTTYTALFTQ